MPCPHCQSTETSVRTKKTSLGYRTFACHGCRRTFNERTGTPYNKEQGWSACVASDEAELRALAAELLAREGRSRGRVIARELAPLRLVETPHQGFPLGREYRAFVYAGQLLAYGFYWDEHSDSARLSSVEAAQVRALAQEVATRLEVPFLAVDIGQLESGEWIVIETGDAQFSGLSQVSPLELWSKLVDAAG